MEGLAWAATSTWRSDLRLFARLAEKAREEIEARGITADSKIEFAVRRDFECYDSVERLLERGPSNTIRSFNSARIKVGSDSLRVEVEMGRKDPDEGAAFSCDLGVALKVTSGVVNDSVLREIRDSMAKLIARGGFSWGKDPTLGPDNQHPDLGDELKSRWKKRHFWAQLIFAAVTTCLGLATLAAIFILEPGGDFDTDGPPEHLVLYFGSVLGAVQAFSFFFATSLYPAIELADRTPGRRILQIAGRSGLLSAAVGVGAAYLKTKVG
jgi:hypothetical protein